MSKVNLGCGDRVAKGWVNLDFNATRPDVQACNLLKPLPFGDGEVNAIYMGHVLEHFSQRDGETLVANCLRPLVKGGILRIVVPDLENICREYLAVLDSTTAKPDDNDPRYEWIIIEVLDQLTRTEPGGAMAEFWRETLEGNDCFMLDYIASRTGTRVDSLDLAPKPLAARLRGLSLKKLRKRIVYQYIKMVKGLLPRSIRNAVLDNTAVGEKHKWMYDRHSLEMLLRKSGFAAVEFLDAGTSGIAGFIDDHLDADPDGSPYKRSSLYCEAVK